MAAAKNSSKVGGKTEEMKKGTTGKAAVVADVEPTARVSRRTAPAKTVVTSKASPSPSPARTRAPGKTVKIKEPVVTAKKSKKEPIENETDSSKGKGKGRVVVSSCASSGSCAVKMIRGYLIIYNLISALAWSFLLFTLGKSFFFQDLHSTQVLFKKTGLYLAYLQTVALLEVLHAALGWVRSGVISNVIQISSRLFVIWVAGVYGGSGKHWAYAMMSVAWALSDLTRYAYYLTQLTEVSAPFLKWARYNFFLVLYPVGTLGEAILIYLARLKWAKNLLLSYTLLIVLAIYTPGFLYMYSHMLQQRAKHFAPSPEPPVVKSSTRKNK